MPEERSCFIISPIGVAGSAVRQHADDVYDAIIKPALKKFDIKPKRSDEIADGGRITNQMFERIFRADLCVVVLTGFNPNVFYELAVAQCAARPTLLLIEQGQRLPFDVQDLRSVEYAYPIDPKVAGKAVKQLKKQLKQLATRNFSVPGLFQQFRFAPRLQTEQQIRTLLKEARPKPLEEMATSSFALPADPERRITIVAGDIIELSSAGRLAELGVQAVVSLENTYLQLDNFFSFSMSGKLRYLDSEKTPGGRLRDSLHQELGEQIRSRGIVLPAQTGTVIPTPTHELAKQGVRAVFHVAGLQGTLGDGYALSDDAIDDCVRGVFDTFAEQADAMGLQTLLLPMIGSFMTRLDQEKVVALILHSVLLKMQQVTQCREVFLLAWIEAQHAALHRVAAELGLQKLASLGAE